MPMFIITKPVRIITPLIFLLHHFVPAKICKAILLKVISIYYIQHQNLLEFHHRSDRKEFVSLTDTLEVFREADLREYCHM